jgi:DNA polymerase-1
MDKVIVTSDAREVASAVSQTNLISVDIETTGLNPHDSRILLVQIGSKNHGTYILVIDRNDLDPLRPLFESEKVLKIFQNGSFDQSFLMHNYHWDIKRVYDTFLAEKLINYRGPRGSHGLETLALKYAGVKLDKTIRSTFSSMRGTDFTQEQLDYAAKDVQVLFPIFDAQAKLLKESGQDKIAKVEFDLSTVVAAMEIAGMPVNIPKWKTLIEETSLEHAASKQRLFSLIYDDNDIDEQMGMFEREPMNIDSNKQLLAVLNRLGINAESTSE